MKSLISILMFFACVSSSMAAVNFTGADAGDGIMEISYTTTDGDLPRGIALRVTLSGNTTIDSVVYVHPAFNCYIDYAYSNQGTYQIGDGHPLADPDAAGVLTNFDVQTFSICLIVLDESGNQAPGPAEALPLIQIKLKGNEDASCTVMVEADSLRGPNSGVVGSILESNLSTGPISFEVDFDPCRLKFTQPGYENQLALYDEYLANGFTAAAMSCWCCPYQCDGDAACDIHFLGYRIYTTDLNLIASSWKAKFGDPYLNPCADIMHDKHFLGYLVYTTDLNKLSANWKLKAPALPGNCPRPDNQR